MLESKAREEQQGSGMAGSDHMGEKPRGRWVWLCGLAVAAMVAHLSVLSAGFVFDDVQNLAQRNRADFGNIAGFFTSNQSVRFGSNFYRPVLNTWIELAFRCFGPHAAAWHAMSLALHVACTLLVFGLAMELMGCFAVAWTAAALFAVHPAQVEAVSWIASVGDLLMTNLLVLSALLFARWLKGGGAAWWAASFVAGAAAVFTKEPAVLLPVMLLALAAVWQERTKSRGIAALATLPLFAVAALFLHLRQSVLQGFSHSPEPVSLAQVLYTCPAALLFYVRHLFWPGAVAPFYPLAMVKSWSAQQVLLPLLAVMAIAAALTALLCAASGWRKAVLCALWFAPLLPALYLKAFAPMELVHDRFLYAPLVGFCMAAALVLQWLGRKLDARMAEMKLRLFPLMVAVLVPLLAVECMSQTLWWHSNATLFRRAVMVTPESSKALDGLGSAYTDAGRLDEAEALMQHALQVNPMDASTSFGLARIAWMRGDDARAEKYVVEALRIEPRFDMWLQLAAIELDLKRVDVAERAARQALAVSPGSMGVHAEMGTVLLAEGRRAEAAQEFQAELIRYPENQAARAGLAQAESAGR